MITQGELKRFYEEKLKPELHALEIERKKLLPFQIGVLIFGGIGILFMLMVFAVNFIDIPPSIKQYFKDPTYLFYTIFISYAVSGILKFILKFKIKSYRTSYKSKIVKSVTHLIDDTWTYSAEGMISSVQYEKSGLFKKGVDSYRGDDLIIGQIEDTDFKCSELHTEYKEVRGTGKDRKTRWYTIFKGLFFHADFNKHFSGKTYVRSVRFSRNLVNSLDLPKVELENLDFSKRFLVTSSDQVEARYILTPTIMEAFINLFNYYHKPIDFSFVDSRVHCAISFEEDLFEPPIYKSVYDFEAVNKIYTLLHFNQVIIKELNLNTRIWTKGSSIVQ
ncbi:DUF3137 domain-containing protein [Flammeovirga sp. MY04]|uniref:DUF3137 domain-containing protein n=1 Tax=Flammeovirga sp. MY04 TaxID=1191459 RepID=UPI000806435D|nr:DUF3137 domain-containing protein [Flammeovirga sp. MY04]ANQ49551.1 DUF3137 domain-containing protein [Flammeovirga sp. MY04]